MVIWRNQRQILRRAGCPWATYNAKSGGSRRILRIVRPIDPPSPSHHFLIRRTHPLFIALLASKRNRSSHSSKRNPLCSIEFLFETRHIDDMTWRSKKSRKTTCSQRPSRFIMPIRRHLSAIVRRLIACKRTSEAYIEATQ